MKKQESSLLDYIIVGVIYLIALGVGLFGWLVKKAVESSAILMSILVVSVLLSLLIVAFTAYTFWPTLGVTFVVIFCLTWLANHNTL